MLVDSRRNEAIGSHTAAGNRSAGDVDEDVARVYGHPCHPFCLFLADECKPVIVETIIVDVHASDQGALLMADANRNLSRNDGNRKAEQGGDYHRNKSHQKSRAQASASNARPMSSRDKASNLVPATGTLMSQETLQPGATRWYANTAKHQRKSNVRTSRYLVASSQFDT